MFAFELALQQLTHSVNQRGIQIDVPLVDACIDIASELNRRYNDEIVRLTKGEVNTTNQVAKLLKFVNDRVKYPLENLQKQTISKWLANHNGDIDDTVLRIIQLRQLNANAAVKKYPTIKNRLCSDGRIRDYLLYYGAHTGRWASKGVQVHNLYQPQISRQLAETVAIPLVLARDINAIEDLFGNPTEVLASLLRSCFIAAPGYKLMGADYNSIEARGIFWLAQDMQGLADFSAHIDIYVRMAAKLHKVNASDVTKSQRFLGKTAILGAQYQLSGAGLQRNCEHKYNIVLDDSFAERAIREYRERYNKVPAFWYALNNAAMRGSGYINRLKFQTQRNFLQLCLPAGGHIVYPYPEIRRNRFGHPGITYMGLSANKKWSRIETYGGALAENATQRVCRDVLASAMLRCQSAQYPPILQVHDEIIVEVPETSKKSVEAFRDLLIERPSWASDFPIEVKMSDCWQGRRYRKG